MTEVETQRVAILRKVIPLAQMRAFYDTAFGTVMSAVSTAGGTPTGVPFGWYHGVPTDTVDIAAGFPVAGLDEGSLAHEVEVVDRPGGRAVVAVHVGPYDDLADSYGRIQTWMARARPPAASRHVGGVPHRAHARRRPGHHADEDRAAVGLGEPSVRRPCSAGTLAEDAGRGDRGSAGLARALGRGSVLSTPRGGAVW